MPSSNHDVFDPYSVENLSELETKLGINFGNKELLERAISTQAARNEHPDLITVDNECLEFLGDSVLKFLISEALFKRESTSHGIWKGRHELEVVEKFRLFRVMFGSLFYLFLIVQPNEYTRIRDRYPEAYDDIVESNRMGDLLYLLKTGRYKPIF